MQKLIQSKIKAICYGLFIFYLFLGGGLFYKFKNTKKSKGNILLIPGFLVNSLTFRPMASFLNKKGYNVYLPSLGWNVWKLENQSDKLEKFWQNQNIEKDVPLFVIGHSMGGLIAHAWVHKYQIKPKKLITLATPFLGSKSIYWGPWCFFPAAKCLLPKEKTEDCVLKKSLCKQINIATKEDALVKKESGLCEEIESQKILLENVGGHSGMQVNKVVFEEVVGLIK